MKHSWPTDPAPASCPPVEHFMFIYFVIVWRDKTLIIRGFNGLFKYIVVIVLDVKYIGIVKYFGI